jgi:hypothetical protein
MLFSELQSQPGTEEFCTVYCVQYMWSRMPHWTVICLWLAAVTVTMAQEGDWETEGERDILASVRDILYEDVESNEIDTDGPALKR